MNINALGLCLRALVFRDLPPKNVLFSDNSRVRKKLIKTLSILCTTSSIPCLFTYKIGEVSPTEMILKM